MPFYMLVPNRGGVISTLTQRRRGYLRVTYLIICCCNCTFTYTVVEVSLVRCLISEHLVNSKSKHA